MSKTPTRLYTVTHKASGKVRLVEATNPNPALSHVARDEYEVAVAEAKDAAVLAAGGTIIEVAGVYPDPKPADPEPLVLTSSGTAIAPTTVIDDETLYRRATNAVRADGRVSISLIQRYTGVTYNVAARIVERMEKEGLVSAEDVHGVRTLRPASPPAAANAAA